MFTQGFGEVITDILTVNPGIGDLPAASSILDTSNYTFNAITYGKDAEGFNFHGHSVSTTQYIDGDSDNYASGYNGSSLLNVNYISTVASAVSSHIVSGTYLQFSSTYNSVPQYPAINQTRLESESTLTLVASSLSSAPFAAITDGGNDEIFTYGSVSLLPSASEYRINDVVTFAPLAAPVPSGLTAGTRYWVVGVDSVAPFAIRVSATKGGSPITPGLSDTFFLVVLLGAYELGHYLNAAMDPNLSGIWNIIGGFAPPSSVGAIYQIVKPDGTNIFSGILSGIYNQNAVVDKNGYVKISQVSGLDTSLGATQGLELSGGSVVFSSHPSAPSAAVATVAVVLQYSDAATLALFGGVNHIGVYCLDLKGMLADGITPPFSWDALNNNRQYKLVSKITSWDNLLYHNDWIIPEVVEFSGMETGLNQATGQTNNGPTFVLKFNFL